MRSDWIEVRVEEIAAKEPNALATGPFGSAIGSRFFQDSGVPVIRGSNLSEDVGKRLIHDDLVFVSPDKAVEFRRSVVRQGDLIFTCWGTIDQVGIIDGTARYPEYVISNKQMKLTPDRNKADSLFLYYLFSGPEMSSRIKSQGIGSSVPGFNLGQLRSLTLRLPPLDEQRAIASILGALDDKIELNRRMNETLESMARALFKSWFVDFDPVHANATGIQSYAMDGDTGALFPAAFEGSNRGPIPTGWKLEQLRDVTTVLRRGISPKYTDFGGIAVLNQKCIRNSRVSLGPARLHDLSKPVSLEQFVQPGDVVVNSTGVGTLGRVGQLTRVEQRTIVDSHVTIVRANPDVIDALLLGQDLLGRQDEIEALGEGSTGQTELGRGRLGQLTVLVAPVPVQRFAVSKLSPLMEAIDVHERESQTLASIRDTLLPRLLSGEIRAAGLDVLSMVS